MWREFLLLLAFVYSTWAAPFHLDKFLTLEDDIATVESLRRDIRAPAPLPHATEVADLLSDGNAPGKNANIKKQMKNKSGKSDEGGYYKTYGSDAEGEKGFFKETFSNGDEGYKTFDTFHKKDSDKYGFEKHVSYGKAQGDEKKGYYKDSGSYNGGNKNSDHEGADTIADTHYTEADHGDGGAEFSHYIGDRSSDHGIADYAGYYSKAPESYNYNRGAAYSIGDDDGNSYEKHSSYSTSSDDESDHR